MFALADRLRSVIQRLIRADDDALAAYRTRIAVHLSLLSATMLLPFTVAHILAGRMALAGMILAVQAILVANGVALRAGRSAPVPFAALVLAMVGAVSGSVLVQGAYGAFWAFPTLFITYFLLPRRAALMLSLLLLVAATAAGHAAGGWPLTGRVFATLLLTLIMINVVLDVVSELQGALYAQSITDPLTGAYNRRHLTTQLAALAEPAPAATPTTVLMALDVDHFKAINDQHGHAAGDAVLRGLVATLGARLRPSDRLFRTGGEEFVLLLPRIAPADALRLAEDLRQRVSQTALVPQHPEWTVTVSIGVAPQRAGRDIDAWQRAVDEAMYAAKRAGRNRVVLVD